MVKDNHKLAEFLLEGIAPQPRGSPQIEVTFSIDQNGILQVSAQDTGPAGSGSKHSVTVTGDQHRLSEEEMQRMMREAELNREADKRIVENTQARNGGWRVASGGWGLERGGVGQGRLVRFAWICFALLADLYVNVLSEPCT